MIRTAPRHMDGAASSLLDPEMLANPSRDAVVIRAPAKVNLFLEILGKRPDGYHELETCMVAVDLCDTLTLRVAEDSTVHLTCDDDSLSTGADNLVCRAAEALRQATGTRCGASIELVKKIPAAAGLAGGSSDAAATLTGLNQLWHLGLSAAALADIAATLGSDVPFFLTASAAWCTGRGEIIAPFALRRPLHLLLACPPTGLSTAEVYRGLTVPAQPRPADAMKAALRAGSVTALGAALLNRLQPVAERLCPEVADLRQVFENIGPVGHVMSGSGSGYLALCRSRSEARALARQVQRQSLSRPGNDPSAGRGPRLFVVRSCG